jgi:hypothetical protein
MAEDDSTGGEVGRVIDVTRPEMLLVETGLLGETLRALTKTDDHYGLALNAWRYQWGTHGDGPQSYESVTCTDHEGTWAKFKISGFWT